MLYANALTRECGVRRSPRPPGQGLRGSREAAVGPALILRTTVSLRRLPLLLLGLSPAERISNGPGRGGPTIALQRTCAPHAEPSRTGYSTPHRDFGGPGS